MLDFNDVHKEYIWSGLEVDFGLGQIEEANRWSPSGVLMDSQWTPCGIHKDCMETLNKMHIQGIEHTISHIDAYISNCRINH
jgi:hypothetical protein